MIEDIPGWYYVTAMAAATDLAGTIARCFGFLPNNVRGIDGLTHAGRLISKLFMIEDSSLLYSY